MNIYFIGQILGYITAGINFCLYLPQVMHVYNIKDTKSLNSHFIILQICSCITTLSYGIIINEFPIIISSISILISASLLGFAKWKLYESDDDISLDKVSYQYESINNNNNNNNNNN